MIAYTKACKGEGVTRTRETCPGIQCDECQYTWTKKSTKLKDIVNRRGVNLLTAERYLNAPALSEDDKEAMQNFIHNSPTLYFKREGTELYKMVEHRIFYYKKLRYVQSFSIKIIILY